MPWNLEPVELDFFENAPYRFVLTETVHHPAQTVFRAIACDPAGWGGWFPGFSDKGRYLSSPPLGTGSRREVTMAGLRYDETILAWDDPTRWAFYVSRSSTPIAHRLAEDYQVFSHGTHSLVRWTFAIDPRPVLGLVVPHARPVLHSLFRRAMTNLSVRLSETWSTQA